MAVSQQEFDNVKRDLKQTQDDLKKVTDILFGIANDTRFQAKVRKQVVDGTTDTGLPIIVGTNGTRWSITNVTKLN